MKKIIITIITILLIGLLFSINLENSKQKDDLKFIDYLLEKGFEKLKNPYNSIDEEKAIYRLEEGNIKYEYEEKSDSMSINYGNEEYTISNNYVYPNDSSIKTRQT